METRSSFQRFLVPGESYCSGNASQLCSNPQLKICQNKYSVYSCLSNIWLLFPQEQSGNDETDMQLMRTHTETLLDTLRDIAQVNH